MLLFLHEASNLQSNEAKWKIKYPSDTAMAGVGTQVQHICGQLHYQLGHGDIPVILDQNPKLFLTHHWTSFGCVNLSASQFPSKYYYIKQLASDKIRINGKYEQDWIFWLVWYKPLFGIIQSYLTDAFILLTNCQMVTIIALVTM